MSGLETLPPDQRAVLKLILEQGRGYEELASLLKVDPAAVRTRAHAGLDALGVAGAGELTPERRAQVADYLLGQQDDGERIVALAELGDSPEAIRWGHALRERLTPLARDPLPELPAVANGNGAASGSVAPPPVPAPERVAVAQPAPPPPPEPPAVVQPAPAASQPPSPQSSSPRSSRLGGAILLAAVAAAVVVGAILLLTGGDDKSPATSTPSVAQTQAQTQTTTTGTPTTAGTAIGQVNLNATSAGGQAVGVGLVLRQKSGKLNLAIQAEKLPGNGAQDIYAAWLQGSGGAKLLGFVPRRVKQNGTFTASAPINGTINNGDTVLITHESTANPSQVPTSPGEAILSGPVQLQR